MEADDLAAGTQSPPNTSSTVTKCDSSEIRKHIYVSEKPKELPAGLFHEHTSGLSVCGVCSA